MPESFRVTLEKVRQRDEKAIAELVAAHHHSLRGYVAAISTQIDSIDDLAQEVFLRALQRLDRIETLDDFPRFLRGIARNVSREHARKYVRSEAYIEFVDEVFASAQSSDAASPFNDPNVLAALRACVQKLSPKSQQMVALRYKEERRADEIGSELGMNGGAVRISLLRVREALLKCLRSTAGPHLTEAGL